MICGGLGFRWWLLWFDYYVVFHSLVGGVGCSSSDGFAWSLGVGVVVEEKEVVGEEALVAEVLVVLGYRLGSLDYCWCHCHVVEADLFFVCYDCAGDGEGFRFLGVEVY